MLYVEALDQAIAFYRDRLGFDVQVFGHHPQSGAPLIAVASLEGAAILLTNEVLFRGSGPGNVRLYFHLAGSVDDLHERIAGQPGIDIIQGPTDQHWGDRTVIVRDPWEAVLVFSTQAEGA
jgi:uncharacterized glyoxalase superfamily protein PhnB